MQSLLIRGIAFPLPLSVSRAKPTKPTGFYWRDADGWELRRNSTDPATGKRKQTYIAGMATSTWQRKFYDAYATDEERLQALAEWILEKLAKKGIAPPVI